MPRHRIVLANELAWRYGAEREHVCGDEIILELQALIRIPSVIQYPGTLYGIGENEVAPIW